MEHTVTTTPTAATGLTTGTDYRLQNKSKGLLFASIGATADDGGVRVLTRFDERPFRLEGSEQLWLSVPTDLGFAVTVETD